MKIVLVGINAKYIHTNLAIRYLKGYTKQHTRIPVETMEFTINQHLDLILREIYRAKPDLLGISCYIWNYEMVKALVPELKRLLPDCIISLGGPEVSYEPGDVLRETHGDLVLVGEGEKSFAALCEAAVSNSSWDRIPGAVFYQEDELVHTPPPSPLDLDELPFVYSEKDIDEGRILYYESSRGCPFSCQYCLSGGGSQVRFRSLEKVFTDMDFFLRMRVKQVKFVDRTFNCRKEYSMAVWRYLSKHDNGVTNFHFELAAELLDEEMIDWLNTVRKGLFQFEIGVQSTHPETLAAIRRITLPDKLTPVIRGLQRGRNIHLHLDLIAGLPYEGYEQFGESFDYVYSLRPDQLQLGFLKVLKGSGLSSDREKYGLEHTAYAPYEVVRTPWLSHDELLRLQMAAEMVELYYNSCRYSAEEKYLAGLFDRPFRFYEALGDFYEAMGYHLAPHAKVEYYTILWEFGQAVPGFDPTRYQWLAKHDLFSHEKAKKLPVWLEAGVKEQYRERIFAWFDRQENVEGYLAEYGGFDTRQLIRSAHIEVFPFDPDTGTEGETAVLYNYRQCDLLGRAKTVNINL